MMIDGTTFLALAFVWALSLANKLIGDDAVVLHDFLHVATAAFLGALIDIIATAVGIFVGAARRALFGVVFVAAWLLWIVVFATAIIGVLVVIIVGFGALTAEVVNFEAVEFADQFLLNFARGSIWAGSGAEDFLALAWFVFAIGVEDDMAALWFGIGAAAPLANAAMVVLGRANLTFASIRAVAITD